MSQDVASMLEEAGPLSMTEAPPPPWSFSRTVNGWFEKAADVVSLEPDLRTILAEPKSELIINFPVRMDDGSVRLFKGYRIQHNGALGPFAGGMRFHPTMTLDDARAIAATLTWQQALLGIPFGGAFGGIKFHPREVSPDELQRITRRFFFSLGDNAGPDYDVPGPDVGTDAQIMAWAMDTFASTVGKAEEEIVKAVVSGKPVASGGTLGREKATGQGLVHVIREWANDRGFDLQRATAIVQGFGNVGAHAAMLLSKMGVSCIAVGDESGYIANAEGLNPHKLAEWAHGNGGVAGYPGGEAISREDFFRTKADIFLPAAIQNQIGADEVSMLDVRLIAEGAFGPLDHTAAVLFRERGIDVLPDVLANAGGAVVSYYEWAQNRRSESWPLDVVDAKLEKAMKRAYHDASQLARRRGVSLRVAAYAVGIQRLQSVYRERDIFP